MRPEAMSLLYALSLPFHNGSLRESATTNLCPCLLDGSPETQRSYRIGDLGRVFLVGISAPAGMTHRNMVDVMPRAFTCSDIPQCDYFSAPQLKARYLVERASDCGYRNPL
jgi:hypothetical protein